MLYPERITIDEITPFELALHVACAESLQFPEVKESLLAQEQIEQNQEELEQLYPACAETLNYARANPDSKELVDAAQYAQYTFGHAYVYGPKQRPVERVGAKWILSRVMFDAVIEPIAAELTSIAQKYDRVY